MAELLVDLLIPGCRLDGPLIKRIRLAFLYILLIASKAHETKTNNALSCLSKPSLLFSVTSPFIPTKDVHLLNHKYTVH